MSDLINEYSVSEEDIDAAKAFARGKESIPGPQLRRESFEAVFRFGRLGSQSGRDDQWIEVRALECSGSSWLYRPVPKDEPDLWIEGNAVGYFREVEDLLISVASGGDGREDDLARCDKWLSTNADLNPVGYYFVPAVFGREAIHEKLSVGPEVGKDGWQVPYGDWLLQDSKVQAVTWISIDNDPVRPKDDEHNELNANDAEHALALATARKQLQLFKCLGIASSALGLGSSGNGARADIAVDLPVDQDFRRLLKRLLRALDRMFSLTVDERRVLTVDHSCSNPTRLLPLFGTIKCKAPHTTERPRRRSWFECAEVVEPVSKERFQELVEQVESLAGQSPSPVPIQKHEADLTPPENLDDIPMGRRVQRAKAYLEKVEPAVSKERGGDGRHNKYVSVIGRVVRGFGLEQDDAVEVLRPWHESCVPPKPERDFLGIVGWASGSPGQTPWGGLLGSQESPAPSEADIEASSLGMDGVLDEEDRAFLSDLGDSFRAAAEPESGPPEHTPEEGLDQEEDLTTIITRTVRIGDERRLVPRPLRENVETYLRQHEQLRGIVRWDNFKVQPVITRMPPWAQSGGAARDTRIGEPWRDLDSLRLGSYLAHDQGMVGIEKTKVDQAVLVAARERPFNSLQDRLRSVKWDGVSRVDGWLHRYATPDVSRGFEDDWAAGDKYVRLVGRWWLIQAVARAMRPGCQADYCLVLEGDQGIQKSSALRVLAGDDYFSDGDLGDLKDKESAMALQGVWIQELGEGEIFKKASQQRLKAFTTVRVDHYIPKFANFPAKVPRSNVFAITTNDSEYLADRTGGRRWWPVYLEDIDLELLAKEVDQLWAEAVVLFERGERWWPQSEKEKALCAEAVGERTLDDPWEETIRIRLRDLVKQKEGISALGIVTGILEIKPKDGKQGHEVRKVREILRRLGWQKGKRDGRRGQLWVRGPEAEPYCPSDDFDEQALISRGASSIPTYSGVGVEDVGLPN